MSKRTKWILIISGLLILTVVLVRVFSDKGADGTKVTAEKAVQRTITETVNASGRVYPEVEVKVSPDISGEITELTVVEGDSVKKGQILARIYADLYTSQRDEAAARVTQSQATVANSQAALQSLKVQMDMERSNYDRNKQLFDEKVISRAEFEQVETRYQSAQAQYNAALQNIRSLQAGTRSTRTSLDMANKNLGRTTIVAPMDGIISSLNVKKGERVVGTAQMAGTEMLRVANMSSMEVRVDVGENDIVKVSIGDSADVEIEAYNKRKFKGIVTQIASSTKTGPTAVATSNDVTNYEVHIRIDPSSYSDLLNPGQPRRFPFRPGMNANADIKTRRKDNVVAVPIGAVASRVRGSDVNLDAKKKEQEQREEDAGATVSMGSDDLEEIVFVINDKGELERRVVTTGIQDSRHFEITSGLKGGETVVTGPYSAVSKTLRTGDRVTVVSQEKLFEKK